MKMPHSFLNRASCGIVFVIISLLLSPQGMAQITAATISGIVKDQSGTAIPGANVELKNLQTGLARSVKTEPNGEFTIPGLPAGNYEARATMQGFTTEVQTNIELTVAEQASIAFAMKVAATGQSIEVSAAAAGVETQSAALSDVVSENTLEELPLNGRNYIQLIGLQPGVNNMAGAPAGNNAMMSIDGQTVRENAVLLDGANIKSLYGYSAASATNTSLGIDTIAEFRVATNAYSADNGRVMGGVINIITKGGTNSFHGDAFEFFRDSVMDARNFFDQTIGAPPFKRNQFGGTAGGPIRKNKVFFFAGVERLQSDTTSTHITTVPDAAARSGALGPVSPLIVPYLNLYPMPNGPDLGGGIAQYIYTYNSPDREYYAQGRLDYQISNKDSVFVRDTFNAASSLSPSGFLPFETQSLSNFQIFTAEDRHIFTTTVLNTARFSFSRLPDGTYRAQASEPAIPASLSFIPGEALGFFQVGGLTNLGNAQLDTTYSDFYFFTYSDDLTWIKGKHQLKMGALVEHQRFAKVAESGVRGQYTFNTLAQFLAATPVTFVATVFQGGEQRNFDSLLTGLYVQDDYRVMPHLTMNLGLRYEPYSVPSVEGGLGGALRNPVTDTTFTLPLFLNPSLHNLGPRVGLAWDPTGKGRTSIRAGAGVYYDTNMPFSADLSSAITVPPFVSKITVSNPTGFPRTPLVGAAALLSPSNLDYHMKQPRSLSFNFNVQQALGGGFIATVGYAGSSGNHLPAIGEVNPPAPEILPGGIYYIPAGAPRLNPAFGTIQENSSWAQSHYNSLQVGVNKPFSKSYRVQLAYTFSKSIDTSPAELEGDPGSDPIPQNPWYHAAERGLSNFDVRNALVANFTWQVPGGRNVILRGWQFNSIFSIHNGLPFTVTEGTGQTWSRVGTTLGSDRPNLNPGFTDSSIILGGPAEYFNPNAFSLQPQGEFGNLGRNTLIGPGFNNVDASLARNVKVRWLGEAGAAQLRFEAFNILNGINFSIPNGQVFSGGESSTHGRRDYVHG